MRLAIVHDDLLRRGGAEQVTLHLHQAFPDAPIYTLAYRPELTYSDFKECSVIPSLIQPIACNETIMKRTFFPWGMWAMRRLDVTQFDVVLMSSTYCAKYVRLNPSALVINFCHCPFRLAWFPLSYQSYAKARGVKRWAFDGVIAVLRKWDYRFAQRVDHFIANTAEMARRIEEAYCPQHSVTIIHPPVACKNFYISDHVEDYYLVVSRFEDYKRVDLAIDAFNELKLPLVVVGDGKYKDEFRKRAGVHITFRSGVDKAELAALYSRCRALIFPPREDYGIVPLEANASGRPVIAFGEGGVLETMIPYRCEGDQATALFFHEQTAAAIIEAVQRFQSISFDPIFIRAHAMKFDAPDFVEKIKSFVDAHYTY